ncbi:GNAT family N-acetyltransferase [Fulvimonas sp. R45]|uniref:GNAT family N-acetyltransferase n=1 Tax=Fulvimonas sp. R45 TaxID=3045937 RepID=UPI00266030E9|nr:GNAT family N-acetyltransferase [Fulvimonas sp. R45]MDO1530017.1 GNAT family N-acetyltransferase [Fulvimonas sp. R45]
MAEMSAVRFRAASPQDAAAAVPLIHSSGPAAFDYVFAVPGRGDAQAFLRHAFVDGAGEFGWRNHVVGELEGVVVAVGAGYGGETALAFTLAAARQILVHYGLRHAPGVVARGLRVERVIPPPSRGMHYLAHLGVSPALRGQGIGRALIEALIRRGEQAGRRRMVLDVAVSNPRAQALYGRLGFAVSGERASSLANAQGVVPGHRRMERVAG